MKAVSVIMLILLLIGILALAFNIQPSRATPSYTVWTDSGIYYAKDSDGTLVYSSTNASDVINWAMTAAGRNGVGTVLLLRGTYYLKTTLFLQSDVHLQGESSELTKITVADSTSGEGFLLYHALVIAFGPLPIINAEMSNLTLDPNSKGITFPLASFDAMTRNYNLKVHDCDFPEGGLDSGAAISLRDSVGAEVYNNIMLNQMHGIYVTDTNYTNIHDNYLDTSTWEGFYFDEDCYYNMVSGNTFRNASYWQFEEHEALQMHGSCKYNTVKDNNFQFCINAIFDEGQANIISNNYFNVVYNGIYIMPNSGVSGDIVTGNHIQNATHVGIGIQDGSNVIVSSNLIEGGSVYNEGLRAYNSNNVTFYANQVKSVYNGINLFQSMFCTVAGNEIATSVYGIYVGDGSDYNTIVSNNISENGCGIELDYSSSNKFCHNNFINNGYQVSVRGESYNNVWDNGYPSGGNYWGDYTVRYPSAQELDDSSIWDTPYVIDADNRDNYPLMNPYIAGDINYDGTVNAFDLSAFNRTYGAMPKSSNWNARADVDNNFIVNVVDLFQLSRNYGKTTT